LEDVDMDVKLSRCSYSFLTFVVDGVKSSASRPDRALPPGMDTRYPLDRKLGEPQTWSSLRGRGIIFNGT
jgi:hypothetical protein